MMVHYSQYLPSSLLIASIFFSCLPYIALSTSFGRFFCFLFCIFSNVWIVISYLTFFDLLLTFFDLLLTSLNLLLISFDLILTVFYLLLTSFDLLLTGFIIINILYLVIIINTTKLITLGTHMYNNMYLSTQL